MASETKLNVSKPRPDPTRPDAKGRPIPSSLALTKSSGSSMAKPVPDPKQKSVAVVAKSEKRVAVSSTKQASGLKPKVELITVKKEVKGKETASSSSKSITKTDTVTKLREKKLYSLPGQKYDIPEERDPLRIFYGSLMKQIPSSEMAEFWMMEHGLLSPEKAKKAFEKKQTKQKQMRIGTPIKSPKIERLPKLEKPESTAKPLLPSRNGEVKPKKRILSYSDDDDDFIVKHKRGKG